MSLVIISFIILSNVALHYCHQLDKINYEIRELLQGNSTSPENPLHCVNVRNPYTYGFDKSLKDYLKCCRIYNEFTVNIKCTPSFIIAGTQKSGTTALSAYLSSLSMISFAPRKEVHFFDKKNYNGDLANYLSSFNNWDYTQYYNPPYFGEASPSYIANRHACKRLHDMIPNIKVIILLREPIARAYSEYQMKKRRVNQQNEFIELATKHQNALHHCFISIPSSNLGTAFPWRLFKECLPQELVSHPHFDKFALNINKLYHDQGLHLVLQKCFSSNSSSNNSSSHSSNIPSSRTSQSDNTNTTSRKRRRRLKQIDPLSQRGDNTTFHPFTCMGKYAREKLISLTEAFSSEVDRLSSCPGLSSLNISESNIAIDSCVNITAGISKDFVYRSMYALQLYHCFQHIPRRQFLILPSERLQNNATMESAIDEITRFLMIPRPKITPKKGIQRNNSASAAPPPTLDPHSVEALMAKYFPKFQKNTGWKVKSGICIINQHLRLSLPLPLPQTTTSRCHAASSRLWCLSSMSTTPSYSNCFMFLTIMNGITATWLPLCEQEPRLAH